MPYEVDPIVPDVISQASTLRGYNLWTWRDHVIYLLESRLNSGSSADLTESVLFRALNDAHLEACRLAGFRRSAEFAVDLVQGTQAYTLPARILANKIVQIRVGNGTTFTPLTLLPVARFYEMYQSGSETGTPVHFTVVPAGRQILLGPTPDSSITGGMRLVAETLPDPLYRIYQSVSGALTAMVTRGSQTVTFSGAVAADIQAGDEFGIVPTAQSDAAAMVEATPQVWFTIADLSDPVSALTLAETYSGPTLAGVSFIVAQVPFVEYEYPGLFGMMVPQLAAARLLTTRDPDTSARLRMEALEAFDFHMDTAIDVAIPKTGVAYNSTVLRKY